MSEYKNVFKYSSPPNMPGVRKLHGVPEKRHIVDFSCNDCNSYIPPNDLPIIRKRQMIDQIEGFGMQDNCVMRLFILSIVIFVIIYAMKKYGM